MKQKQPASKKKSYLSQQPIAQEEVTLLRQALAQEISSFITAKNLSQYQAADILGISQPKVSALVAGKLAGFSFSRLFRFITLLGKDITISVSTPSQSRKSGSGTIHIQTKQLN